MGCCRRASLILSDRASIILGSRHPMAGRSRCCLTQSTVSVPPAVPGPAVSDVTRRGRRTSDATAWATHPAVGGDARHAGGAGRRWHRQRAEPSARRAPPPVRSSDVSRSRHSGGGPGSDGTPMPSHWQECPLKILRTKNGPVFFRMFDRMYGLFFVFFVGRHDAIRSCDRRSRRDGGSRHTRYHSVQSL